MSAARCPDGKVQFENFWMSNLSDNHRLCSSTSVAPSVTDDVAEIEPELLNALGRIVDFPR